MKKELFIKTDTEFLINYITILKTNYYKEIALYLIDIYEMLGDSALDLIYTFEEIVNYSKILSESEIINEYGCKEIKSMNDLLEYNKKYGDEFEYEKIKTGKYKGKWLKVEII